MSEIRPVDANFLRHKVTQMHDRLARDELNKASNAAKAAMKVLESIQRMIDKTATLKVESETKLTCDGCIWLGKRHQKCTCCRRNQNAKDNYAQE